MNSKWQEKTKQYCEEKIWEEFRPVYGVLYMKEKYIYILLNVKVGSMIFRCGRKAGYGWSEGECRSLC